MTLDDFLKRVEYPFVIVSTLLQKDREAVLEFLIKLGAPVYAEGISNLREEERLAHLRITQADNAFKYAEASGYPIDGVLRIGGVPTTGLWRNLEDTCESKTHVCSINCVPFSGLSWGTIQTVCLETFFINYKPMRSYSPSTSQEWRMFDQSLSEAMMELFAEEPHAETSLVHELSKIIADRSLVFVGTSLPIREWDSSATREQKNFKVYGNRGVNGIDGIISSFLGLAAPDQDNWALIGDLTALYDMAAFWVLPQLNDIGVNVVILNNGGGKIFAPFYPQPQFQNLHNLNFGPLAAMWGLGYSRWTEIPEAPLAKQSQIIEIIPDNEATIRFWQKFRARCSTIKQIA